SHPCLPFTHCDQQYFHVCPGTAPAPDHPWSLRPGADRRSQIQSRGPLPTILTLSPRLSFRVICPSPATDHVEAKAKRGQAERLREPMNPRPATVCASPSHDSYTAGGRRRNDPTDSPWPNGLDLSTAVRPRAALRRERRAPVASATQRVNEESGVRKASSWYAAERVPTRLSAAGGQRVECTLQPSTAGQKP